MKRMEDFKKVFSVIICVLTLMFFPISADANIYLTNPEGGEVFEAEEIVDVQWYVEFKGVGSVDVEFSADGGETFTYVVENLPVLSQNDEDGSINWVVPDVDSSECVMQATYYVDGNGMFVDTSAYFKINPIPYVLVILENGYDGYSGAEDNTMYEESENTNGGGDFIFVGNTDYITADYYRRRGLIKFDLSDIPKDVIVTWAALELTVAPYNTDIVPIRLHKLTVGWGEGFQIGEDEEEFGTEPFVGDATWISNFHDITLWTNPGGYGDYNEMQSASGFAGDIKEIVELSNPMMTEEIQAWIEGTDENHGWIIIGNENEVGSVKTFYSSDSTEEPSARPRLIIEYVPEQQIPVELDDWYAY
jgi:hypothetical protein